MSAGNGEAERDIAAMEEALARTGQRLHGIGSRTAPRQVAAEVLRLNDAVRAAAQGRIAFGSQPGDFAALLLAAADPLNGDAA